MRHLEALMVLIAVAVLGCPVSAFALPKPAMLDQTFANDIPSGVKLSSKAPRCRVHVSSITDTRRSPEIIGVHERRPVFAPQDRPVWLKSIIQALGTRGLTLSFAGDGAAADDAVKAEIALTTAWITDTKVNISAGAVFRVQASAPTGVPVDQYYRGGNSRMTYWSNGAPVLQNAINTAFARAIDAMAVDLLKLCGIPAETDR